MGMWTCLFGYIGESTARAAADVRVGEHNDAILAGLPENDSWPPLSRSMFGWPPHNSAMITYGGRKFHFAAGLKSIDDDLDLWIAKFEALLRTMCWSEAVVIVQGYIIPFSELRWVAKWQGPDEPADKPPRKWTFETTMEPLLWADVISGRMGGRGES